MSHFLRILLSHLRNLLGGGDGAHRFESLPPTEAESRREASSDLLFRLRGSLPTDCERLDQGNLDVVGQFPVAAGGMADVWEGRIGQRKVAIKSYRCYSSSDRLPTDVVSGSRPLYILSAEDIPTEVLQRNVYGEPPQTPERNFVHRMVFDP